MAHFVYLNVVLRHFLDSMFLNVISVVPEETKKSLQDIFFNFNNLFLDKGCGHKLTHTK